MIERGHSKYGIKILLIYQEDLPNDTISQPTNSKITPPLKIESCWIRLNICMNTKKKDGESKSNGPKTYKIKEQNNRKREDTHPNH